MLAIEAQSHLHCGRFNKEQRLTCYPFGEAAGAASLSVVLVAMNDLVHEHAHDLGGRAVFAMQDIVQGEVYLLEPVLGTEADRMGDAWHGPEDESDLLYPSTGKNIVCYFKTRKGNVL